MVQQIALNPNASLEPHKPYVKPKIKNERPAYVVIGKAFFDHNDKFRQTGSMFYYDFEPSLDLKPLNQLANDKMNAFLQKLNDLGVEMAKKTKKSFTSYDIKEWKDEEEVEVPMPDYLMGVPRDNGLKDEIR